MRAVALVRPGTPPPGTFDPVPATDDFAGGITLATTALSLLAEGHGLILAPASPPMRDLAHALQRAGHPVGLAGFEAPAGASVPVRRLGRDCLFVP